MNVNAPAFYPTKKATPTTQLNQRE